MAKKLLQRFMPSPHHIYENRYLKPFKHFLTDPNLWHLNRYSVATAMSIGLFIGYMPFPGHMIMAALVALLLRANLPFSVALVWASNPFTMGPMFFFAYELGTKILRIPPEKFHIEFSYHWLAHELKHYYEPLLIGSFICGACLALIGNVGTRLFWRYHVIYEWRKRAKKRKKAATVDMHS
jgi:uncharacterized protein (DUF2062 family)